MAGRPLIHEELRVARELGQLLASSSYRHPRPVGQGRPVLLVPGYLAGDDTLRLLAGWLKRSGFAPRRSGIIANVECSEQTMSDLEARLEVLCEQHGGPVSYVGHSRGGMLGRAMLLRRPDLIDRLVTLGSPLQGGRGSLTPLLELQLEMMLSSPIRGLLNATCRRGAPGETPGDGSGCCERFWEDLLTVLPLDDEQAAGCMLCVRSRQDGVVAFAAAADSDQRVPSVTVESSHCGMACNRHVFQTVAAYLAA